MKHFRIRLSLGDGTPLPSEFRLFTAGWNDTENGRFLFDETAAQAVMSAYQAWGVDLMIDLEHQSLDVQPGAPDPTARDARGWCKLELRGGGELWAIGATWTPDGAARLQNKTQRYVSPAFDVDPKTNRVTKMINIAITAIPATHNTPALVAASRRKPRMNKTKLLNAIKLAQASGLDPDLVVKALNAVEAGDLDAAMQILKSMIASAAGASPDPGPDPDAAGEPGSEGDGTQPTQDSAAPPPPAAKPGAPDDSDDPAKKTEHKAMRVMLCSLAGKETFAEAVAEAEKWRVSHLTLETERQQLSAQRATIEAAERRALAIELVTIKAEFPSTVWADDKAVALKPRWLKMPIEELRQHVAEQKLARKSKTPAPELRPGALPAESTDADIDAQVAALTPMELRICKAQKCDPKEFVKLRNFRDGKRTGN